MVHPVVEFTLSCPPSRSEAVNCLTCTSFGQHTATCQSPRWHHLLFKFPTYLTFLEILYAHHSEFGGNEIFTFSPQ